LLNTIKIVDSLLYTPERYRELALAHDFKDEVTPAGVFHGVAKDHFGIVPSLIQRKTGLTFSSHISIIRRSPLGQKEPNFIHNDADMGDVTAILYLTPKPPEGDGTLFWEHTEHGERGPWPLATGAFHMYQRVEARFNRLVIFPSDFYHSRAIEENYGEGDDARLIQVTFLKY
jgi:hypothetical protein